MMRLAGKTALITGASKGIGAAISRRFAAEGCALFLAGGADKSALDATVAACRKFGTDAWGEAIDLGRLETAEQLMAKTIEHLGPPEILVNCAGARSWKAVAEIGIEDIERLFRINAMAPFVLSTIAARHMIDRKRGRILNIGSTSGLIGTSNNSLYCATKGALHAMTMALAVELGPYGIRVNALAPGTTTSEGTTQRIKENPRRADAILRSTPIGRFATPEDIAAWAAFIVSDEADLANGVIFVLDGGRLAGR